MFQYTLRKVILVQTFVTFFHLLHNELSDSSPQVWQYCEVILKLPYTVICYFDMLAVENVLVSKAVYYRDDIISCEFKFSFFSGQPAMPKFAFRSIHLRNGPIYEQMEDRIL